MSAKKARRAPEWALKEKVFGIRTFSERGGWQLQVVDGFSNCFIPIVSLGLLAVIYCASPSETAYAQELEPRAFANTPVGLNFLIGAYAHSKGTVGTDPSVPLKDTDVKLNSAGSNSTSAIFFLISSRQQFTLLADNTLEVVLTSEQKLQYDSP